MAGHTLDRLAALIAERRQSSTDKSYTRQLLDGGTERCAKKFGEEAIEAIIAAVGTDREVLKGEAADVLYHLIVLLESRRVPLSEVCAVLENRMGQSGLDEKSARGVPKP